MCFRLPVYSLPQSFKLFSRGVSSKIHPVKLRESVCSQPPPTHPAIQNLSFFSAAKVGRTTVSVCSSAAHFNMLLL